MSALQLGLIVAGIALVIGVIIYNAWAERRVRRRIAAAFHPAPDPPSERAARARSEPTLRDPDEDAAGATSGGSAAAVRPPVELPASPFAVPMDDVSTLAPGARSSLDPEHEDELRATRADDADDDVADDAALEPGDAGLPPPARAATLARTAPVAPDPDIECIVGLALAQPVTAATLSAGLHARLGKPLRWFGRAAAGAPWQVVTDASAGRYIELAACLLLADRNGPLSEAQLATFFRIAGELGAALGARVTLPDVRAEVQRGEALDRLCADLDVQIGLTVLKAEPGAVAGTRLRGVAEAAGFHLAPGGRFEHVHEDTGAVLFTLQNVRNEPFTAESLRLTSTPGVVFLLDVPRVADPARAFDQMKLAAKRMAHTLGGELVDDNRRALDDAALAKIRAHVQAAADGLAEVHIEPGSTRAIALFGA